MALPILQKGKGYYLIRYSKGKANSSPEQITDNLLNLLEQGMAFLRTKSGLQRRGNIGTESRDELEIPDTALREALANALVHRDYEQERDQPTRIHVFPDRVEIISFGEALVDMNQDPEDIISTKRNHTIAEIFRIMQRVELNASGISRMHEVMRAAKLPPPIIKEMDSPAAVKVIFRRPRPEQLDTSADPDFTLSENFVGRSLLNAGAPFQAPPLPSYFVDRPEYRREIKEYVLSRVNQIDSTLLNSTDKSNTLVVSAIYGLGGIGKSVLAAAIAHDREIHARFPDGILWATLGQNPDILPLLSNWIQALGDYDYQPVNQEAASTHLQTQLYDKRALLIVDDVWNPEDADFFRVGGTGCCVLVTTREAQIAGAIRYDLNVMTPQQSLKLMIQAAGQDLSESERQSALMLAQEVGYLPLALELVTAQVSMGISWAEMLAKLKQEVVRLADLDRIGSETIDEPKRRKHSLVASFNLSLRLLSEEQRAQFAWLGIVPEDVTLTEAMAATLWKVPSRKAGRILQIFRAKALLLQGGQQTSHKLGYRMHDLMHDLAQDLLRDDPHPTQPSKLPGLGLSIEVAHATLLAAYKAKTQGGLWHTIPDDSYIHAHLTWHLQQANQLDEIHALMAEETADGRNGWYVACDELGQVSNFVTDIGRAWNLASQLFEQDTVRAIGLQYRYALIKTSLNSLAQTVPSELVVALIEAKIWQPAQGLAYAQQLRNPYARSKALENLVPSLPESLLSKALEVACSIQDESARARALRELAKQLPELLPEALEVTRSIQAESSRAYTLCELAKQLPELLPEALEVTRSIQDESSRADALCELAKQLPPELLPEALEVTRSIQDESSRADALCELAKQLPELLPEALEVTRSIQAESSRADALRELAKQLPMIDALGAIQELRSEYYQAVALTPILKQLNLIHLEWSMWTQILQSLASQVRRNFISNLPNLAPVFEHLGGENALREVVQEMRDVAEQWP